MNKCPKQIVITLIPDETGLALKQNVDENGITFGHVHVDFSYFLAEDPSFERQERGRILLTGPELALARDLFDEVLATSMVSRGCVTLEEAQSNMEPPTEYISPSLWSRIRRALGF